MYYGWVQDSIEDLASSGWSVFDEYPYCLVTCIDSVRDLRPSLLCKDISGSVPWVSFNGKTLVVSEGGITDLARKHRLSLFPGFDEVWLFRNFPCVEKPANVKLTMPTPDFQADAPTPELIEWFRTSECVLGLGDGIGMNYVTASEEIVSLILARQRSFDDPGDMNSGDSHGVHRAV